MKEDPTNNDLPKAQNEGISTERDGDGEVFQVRYFVDTLLVSKDVYDSKDSTNYFHDVTTQSGSVLQTESHCFTSKALYEYWGTTKAIPVAKSNQLDDRIQKISDSLGITSIVMGGGTPDSLLAAKYNALVTSTYNALFPSSGALSYTGCDWYTNYSNGVATGRHYFLPTQLVLPSWFSYIYPWLEDNTEAVRFKRSSFNPGARLHLKAWRLPLFKGVWGGWPRIHTVVFGPGVTEITLPFIGPVAKWNNKISSWVIIPPPV
ncbi:MAG: hypothetical protein NW218_13195 [Saprospiraceae bacterium]|nr:hypothetical protein [Saprospiraceae bacterium]